MKYFVTLEDKVESDEKAFVSLLKSNTDGMFDQEFTIKDYTGWIKSDL